MEVVKPRSVLRIVDVGRPDRRDDERPLLRSRNTVAPEQEEVWLANRLAAELGPDDARLVFALRIAALIEGGRLAMLRAERRTTLLGLATRLGIRPFDANLIIAIVQDQARRGESVAAGLPTLRLIRPPAEGAREMSRTLVLCVAVLLGVAAACGLVAALFG